MSENFLAIGYPDNPELQEQRCRICYLPQKPLVTVCQCSGSIQYVHEECVIEWITKQIEKAQVLQIPRCQICQQQYNAKLYIGKRKICTDILLDQVVELPKKQLFTAGVYIIGAVAALLVLIVMIMTQVVYLVGIFRPEVVIEMEEIGLKAIFTDIVFPIIFMNSCIKFFKKLSYIWEDSYVQLVELILTPKIIVKG